MEAGRGMHQRVRPRCSRCPKNKNVRIPSPEEARVAPLPPGTCKLALLVHQCVVTSACDPRTSAPKCRRGQVSQSRVESPLYRPRKTGPPPRGGTGPCSHRAAPSERPSSRGSKGVTPAVTSLQASHARWIQFNTMAWLAVETRGGGGPAAGSGFFYSSALEHTSGRAVDVHEKHCDGPPRRPRAGKLHAACTPLALREDNAFRVHQGTQGTGREGNGSCAGREAQVRSGLLLERCTRGLGTCPCGKGDG